MGCVRVHEAITEEIFEGIEFLYRISNECLKELAHISAGIPVKIS